MSSAQISTYDTERLSAYFRSHVPNADSASAWHHAVSPLLAISSVSRVLRRATIGRRAKLAAIRWLDPSVNLGLADLSTLQADTGLRYLTFQTFVSNLQYDSMAILREHPELRHWCLRRAALLDYVINRPAAAGSDLMDVAIALRRALLESALLLGREVATPTPIERICDLALNAAARAVTDVFSRKTKSIVSANLMVPDEQSNAGLVDRHQMSRSNRSASNRLWESVERGRSLVAIAGTDESRHIGFWVPLSVGRTGLPLPGAPEAYTTKRANAVFVDDPPPLPGFDDVLVTRWRAYLKDEFRDNLFISLPFCVPVNWNGDVTVAAVLNVDVQYTDDTGWRRAYHQEWLSIAEHAAMQFVEIAYWALLLSGAKDGTPVPAPSTELSWDHLPPLR